MDGDLDVLDSLTIVGAGPASTIIDGNGVATGDRVMRIFKCIGSTTVMQGSCPGGTDVVVDISGVAFRHGQQTSSSGGGIFNSGMLTLNNCAIADNTSFAAGGISTFLGTATVTGSTISGNRAQTVGGIQANFSTLSLINTTISGNFSDGSSGGLAVTNGTAGLYNVTITGNQANADDSGSATGGGIVSSLATVTLSNSIVTNNIHRNDGSPFDTLDDCSGSFISAGNNIVTNVIAAECTINGSFSSVGAGLGPPQDNGGPTLTHALLTGSAATDAGNPGGCTDNFGATLTTDQRGEQRPTGAFCDIGAFEVGDTIFRDGFES